MDKTVNFQPSERRSDILGRADVLSLCTLKEDGMVTKAIESWSTPMFQVRCTFKPKMEGAIDALPTGMAFDPNAGPDVPLEEHVCAIASPDEIIVTDMDQEWHVVRKLTADQLRMIGIPVHPGSFKVPDDFLPENHRTRQLTIGDRDMILKKIEEWLFVLNETGKPPELVN